jgi:hypothetical protein
MGVDELLIRFSARERDFRDVNLGGVDLSWEQVIIFGKRKDFVTPRACDMMSGKSPIII